MASTLPVLTGIVLAVNVTALPAAEPARPNIVLIVADDLGFGDLSVHGCKDIPTPYIDSLATVGVRATNGYVSGPYCSPTRAGLMTGRYQQRFGHEFNPGPISNESDEYGLALTETTLPQLLRDAGYATGLVGKWHLGHKDVFQPPSRGFDEFFGFWGGSHSYLKDLRDSENPIVRGREPVAESAYLTDAFAREAVAFIDRHKQHPFFLYYAFNAVHNPAESTDEYQARFASIADEKRRTYAAMLSAMDDAIGHVLAKLEADQLTDRTLIFFISDNGGPEKVNFSDNGPFRGVKATTWEGGIHVPFLVQWKDHLPAGTTYEQPVIQLDIVPTVLAAAGINAPDSIKLDGVNLLPYLTGEYKSVPHESLYWRFGAQTAIRSGDWKLVKATLEGAQNDFRGESTMAGAQLYNLRDDIGEQTDVAAQHPEVVRRLNAEWNAWNAQLPEPAWRPRNRANRRAAAAN
jgi:arylsulfatase A-like enzyme